MGVISRQEERREGLAHLPQTTNPDSNHIKDRPRLIYSDSEWLHPV